MDHTGGVISQEYRSNSIRQRNNVITGIPQNFTEYEQYKPYFPLYHIYFLYGYNLYACAETSKDLYFFTDVVRVILKRKETANGEPQFIPL
jgi:hypothetical protein